MELELEDAHDEFLVHQHKVRAQVHAGPLRELNQRKKNEAQRANLAKDDLNTIIDKLEDENDENENLGSRPRRQAAIVAAQMRQQMIDENRL